ncbi:MAG: DNA topoisomerase I [Promethearchaeota archaeon]
MMVYLIIAEKRSQAEKIGRALDKNSNPKIMKSGKSPVYLVIDLFDTGGKGIIVSASGHLYKLEKDEGQVGYPSYRFSWKRASRGGIYKYIALIRKIVRENTISQYIVATDLDTEGSVIGYNVIRFACAKSPSNLERIVVNANRMEFSTLTTTELRNAWKNRSKSLDCNRVSAGYARHWVDVLFGINLSQALTSAVKVAGKGFQVFSMGRVQGPTLKAVHDRDLAIENHVPMPYWELETRASAGTVSLKLESIPLKFNKKNDAIRVKNECEGKTGKVSEINERKRMKGAPIPFSLGGLQREANKLFRFKPAKTLKIAEKLYLNALVSYPRTESEIIPPEIDLRAIMAGISKIQRYSSDAGQLLTRATLVPSKGKKFDKAHPPILPTGTNPASITLSGDEIKLYDLVVRRFLALFGTPLKWVERTYRITAGSHQFKTRGEKIVDNGWTDLYTYHSIKHMQHDPGLLKDQEIMIDSIKVLDKFTKPPPHYSDITLLGYMERENIGTKSTRAAIIDKLKSRNYVEYAPVRITDLGKLIVRLFDRYLPEITSVGLTRDLEESMEKIMEGKQTVQNVISNTRKILDRNLALFKQNEQDIGSELGVLVKEKRKKNRILGKCPSCGENLVLIVKKDRKRFIACEGYFKKTCTVTLPVAQKGRITSMKTTCPHCKFPMAKIFMKGRPPWEFCLNWAHCPGKIKRKEEEGKKNGGKNAGTRK